MRKLKVGDEVIITGNKSGCSINDKCVDCKTHGRKQINTILSMENEETEGNRQIQIKTKGRNGYCYACLEDLELANQPINLKKLYEGIKDERV